MNADAGNSLDVRIREMTESDLADVVRLERKIFPDPWPLSAFAELVSSENPGIIVGESNGDIVGYASYYVVENESHLTNIAVDPEHRRKSVAKRLLQNILRIVQERGCDRILLEVRPSNVGAIAFYEKHGFRLLYRKPSYYRRPIEDAQIMVRYLNDELEED